MEELKPAPRNYVIISTKKLDTLDFSKLSLTKRAVIYNKPRTKCMVKYENECPPSLINEFHVSAKEFKHMLADKNSSWYIDRGNDEEFILVSTWKTIKRLWKRNNPFKK